MEIEILGGGGRKFDDVTSGSGVGKGWRRVGSRGRGRVDSNNVMGGIEPNDVEGDKSVFHPKGINAVAVENKDHTASGTETSAAGEPPAFLRNGASDF